MSKVPISMDIFADVVDAIPANIYWKDMSGRYLGCNKHMLDTMSSTLVDVVGKTDKELPWEKNAKKIQQVDNLVIKNNIKHEDEGPLLMAKDQKRIYLSIKNPLCNEASGKVIGMTSISFDITDKKNAERSQNEREINKKFSQILDVLSNGIGHEIRTPLAVIGINVDNLNMKLKGLLKNPGQEKLKKEFEEIVKNIKFAINNASNIISMLLVKLRTVLGSQGDKITIDKERTADSIKFDVDNAIKEYPFFGKERELLEWNIEDGVNFKYKGNPLLTKHIIFNLIKNSLRAIKGVERGKIYISLRSGKDFNRLIIKDTASGVSPEVLKYLFQQFTSGSRDGAGLGLAFCKMTMKSYGGDITCDSKEGEYTEFTLSFPVINLDPEVKKPRLF